MSRAGPAWLVVGDGVMGDPARRRLSGGTSTDPAAGGWVGCCIHPRRAGRGLATELTLAPLGLLLDDDVWAVLAQEWHDRACQ